MRRRLVLGLGTVLFCMAACGDGSERPRQRGSQSLPPIPSELPALPGESPDGDTTPTTPSSASFTLLGPALPPDVLVDRQRARLTGATGVVQEIESTHPGLDATAPITVSAGTYTVTFLDENGNATAFEETVTITAGEQEVLRIGSVWITPSSAAQTERSGTGALQLRIGDAANTLRTAPGALNTVIDVPASQAWQFFGLGIDGELPPVTFSPGAALLNIEFGSIFVRRNLLDSVQIRAANGVTLFPATSDFVEYLVPTTTQTQGCMVYLGIVNQLTTQTITLCSDAVRHVLLDAR